MSTPTRYHVNPTTNKAGICRATTQPCRFNISRWEHFENKAEAEREAIRMELYKEYDRTGYNAIIGTEHVDINGTSLVGTFEMTYETLVDKIGKPTFNYEGEGDKVQAEWTFRTPFGSGTIYDWKEYDTPLTNVTDWHIGGKNKKIADLVEQQLHRKSHPSREFI